MRDHDITGAVVSLLSYFIQPIFWLMMICKCVDHIVGCVATALHSIRKNSFGFLLFFLFWSLVFSAIRNLCLAFWMWLTSISYFTDALYSRRIYLLIAFRCFNVLQFGCVHSTFFFFAFSSFTKCTDTSQSIPHELGFVGPKISHPKTKKKSTIIYVSNKCVCYLSRFWCVFERDVSYLVDFTIKFNEQKE